MDNIAARILQLCNQHKITRKQLSELSNVPDSTLKEIIRNPERDPRVGTIRQVCEGLGISLGEFFSPDPHPELPAEAIAELKEFEKYILSKYSNPGK